MSQATTINEPTKLDEFRMQVLPPERKSEIVGSLPSHVKPERFERNLVNALMQNPRLMECDPRLVFREVSKAAALGLYLDPQLGEAYLIIGWNGKARREEPQLRIGYRGLIKLGRQSGEIGMIYAHEVHANDVFECSLGDSKSLSHKPNVFGDRGDIVGYYAVVKYQDGESDFETMTVKQAHEIRDRSDGWKAFQAGKIKSTPWSTDEVEMSKKSVIRRLTKRIPQSPEMADAIRIEDSAEYGEVRPATPRLVPPANLGTGTRALVPPSPAEIEARQQQAATGRSEQIEDLATVEHEDVQGDERPVDAPEERQEVQAEPVAKTDPADPDAPVPDIPEDRYVDTIKDWLERIRNAEDRDILTEIWTCEVEPQLEKDGAIFPPDIDKLNKAFDARMEALKS